MSTEQQKENALMLSKVLADRHINLGLCIVPTDDRVTLDETCPGCRYIHDLTGWPFTPPENEEE